jgi:hypothetical protein
MQEEKPKRIIDFACNEMSNMVEQKFGDLQIRFDQAVQDLNQKTNFHVDLERKETTLKEEGTYGYLFMVESDFTLYKEKIDVLIQSGKNNFLQALLDFCENKEKQLLRKTLRENAKSINSETQKIKSVFLSKAKQRELREKDQRMLEDQVAMGNQIVLRSIEVLRKNYTKLFDRYLREFAKTHNDIYQQIETSFSLKQQ